MASEKLVIGIKCKVEFEKLVAFYQQNTSYMSTDGNNFFNIIRNDVYDYISRGHYVGINCTITDGKIMYVGFAPLNFYMETIRTYGNIISLIDFRLIYKKNKKVMKNFNDLCAGGK